MQAPTPKLANREQISMEETHDVSHASAARPMEQPQTSPMTGVYRTKGASRADNRLATCQGHLHHNAYEMHISWLAWNATGMALTRVARTNSRMQQAVYPQSITLNQVQLLAAQPSVWYQSPALMEQWSPQTPATMPWKAVAQ